LVLSRQPGGASENRIVGANRQLLHQEAQVHRCVARGSPKRVDISRPAVSLRDESDARHIQRACAALAAGVGFAALGLLSFGPGLAVAGRSGGGDSPLSFIASQSAASGDRADDPGPSRRDHANSGVASAQSLASRAVCVRLCDGSFFPVNGVDARGSEAACARQCPGAPTQVFFRAAGSDQIEGATASNGQAYSALPVAFRYRSTLDNTCTCGARSARETSAALFHDLTLRKGDFVMTATGVRVFRGGRRPPYDANDFTDLAQSSLPRETRDALVAMDRANAGAQGTSASQAAPDARSFRDAGIRPLGSIAVSSSPAN
jgi:hypothetical protein